MAFRDAVGSVKKFFSSENTFFNGPRKVEPSENTYDSASQATPAYVDSSRQQAAVNYQPMIQQNANPQQASGNAYGYTQAPQQQAAQIPSYNPSPLQNGYYPQNNPTQSNVPPRRFGRSQQSAEPENVVQFPAGENQNFQSAPQQPQAPQQNEQPAYRLLVVNIRGISDCISAITSLQNGISVIAVADSIADQVEIRRYVDTLNGACFALNCSMTRLSSRVGVYCLAPKSLEVKMDTITSQMNQRSHAPRSDGRGQQNQQATPYGAPRSPYNRPAQNPYPPTYTAQVSQGYVPDSPEDGYQEATI